MAEFAPKSRDAIRNILILKEFFYSRAPVASRPEVDGCRSSAVVELPGNLP